MKTFDSICSELLENFETATGVRYFSATLFVKWLRNSPAQPHYDWFFDEDDDLLLQIFFEKRALDIFSGFGDKR